MDELESINYDVVVTGAGPSGLACAIKLKQLALQNNLDISIAVFEKSAQIGGHIISGCVMNPEALRTLIPDYEKKLDLPLYTPVTQEELLFLTPQNSFKLPIPKKWQNNGNYVISLSRLCNALGEHAQSIGIDIFPSTAISDAIIVDNRVVGVLTDSMAIYAKHVVLAEGARGSLSRSITQRFNLESQISNQTYGLGIKEIWRVDKNKHKQGYVLHALGYPLNNNAYGGGFMYHMNDNLVALGLVCSLDYSNPYLNPYEEFQKFKLHPKIKNVLLGGKRIEYGARSVVEGGVLALPKLNFPGGIIIGDSAGFLNVPQIKGVHNAMHSGMIAASAIIDAIKENKTDLSAYSTLIKQSNMYKELHMVRNIRPAFKYGLYLGLMYSAIDYYIFRGHTPWNLKFKKFDYQTTKMANLSSKIDYPKHDNQLTFDKSSSLSLSNLTIDENQPSHLKLKNTDTPIAINLNQYQSPETRYCPANVYQIMQVSNKPLFKVNAGNCLHCKACDIKDPTQNITWSTPNSGSGPNYSYM